MTGAELKRMRCELGLTQSRLAVLLGVAPNTIARWERGEVPIQHGEMLRLAMERIEQLHTR